MRCKYFNDVSNEWIQEKMQCTNTNARERVRKIQQLVGVKRKATNNYFNAQEFTDFLRFKGASRMVEAFEKRYANSHEVENVTRKLFTSELNNFSFEDTYDELKKQKIKDVVAGLLADLMTLNYVREPVASACLALCFPDLCATVDYIVPTMLHNEFDHVGNQNPLFLNEQSSNIIRASLLLPVCDSLTSRQARNLGKRNYTHYVEEIWNIKRNFSLTNTVREVEVAFWSFGICYLKKRDERLPLEFNHIPNPPTGGPFSKYCLNNS